MKCYTENSKVVGASRNELLALRGTLLASQTQAEEAYYVSEGSKSELYEVLKGCTVALATIDAVLWTAV